MRERIASNSGGNFRASAQRFQRLIHGESRRIGRDLKQNSAGLTEIDRLEVVSVHYRRHVVIEPDQPSRQRSCCSASGVRHAM